MASSSQNKPGESNPNQRKASKLGRYGKEVYDFISKPAEGGKETEEIEKSIYSAITNILAEVVKIDRRFQHKLICSGSYYDGLKIESADEFDYLVELTSLSADKLKTRDVLDKNGFSSVTITDSNLAQTWHEILTKEKQIDVLKLETCFEEVITEALSKRNFRLPEKLSLNEPPFKSTRVGVDMSFTWRPSADKSDKISVDLVPTVRLPGWPAASDFPARLKKYPAQAQRIAAPTVQLGYRLVPFFDRKNHKIWRISFSATESELLRGICQSKEHVHRDVLLTLKFLYNTYGFDEWFPRDLLSSSVGSYIMKTSFLKEWEQCPDNSNWTEAKFAERILSILKRIQREFNQGVRNFFVEDYKVYSPSPDRRNRSSPEYSLEASIQKMKKIAKGEKTGTHDEYFLAAVLRKV